MDSSEKKELSKLEQTILFEITELDDAALDAVSGGLLPVNEPTNGSMCSCTNYVAC